MIFGEYDREMDITVNLVEAREEDYKGKVGTPCCYDKLW
jgi:hypothetical protein